MKPKPKFYTCLVCRVRNREVKPHSIVMRRLDVEVADVDTSLCLDCADRVADAMEDLVRQVRSDHNMGDNRVEKPAASVGDGTAKS